MKYLALFLLVSCSSLSLNHEIVQKNLYGQWRSNQATLKIDCYGRFEYEFLDDEEQEIDGVIDTIDFNRIFIDEGKDKRLQIEVQKWPYRFQSLWVMELMKQSFKRVGTVDCPSAQ